MSNIKNKIISKKGWLAGLFTAAMLCSGAAIASQNDDDNHVQLSLNADLVVLHIQSNIYNGFIDNPMYSCPAGTDTSICDANSIDPMKKTAIRWHYYGDVFAAVVNPASGIQSGPVVKVGTVEGYPLFPNDFMALQAIMQGQQVALPDTMPWTCDSCKLVLNGSTFRRIDTMQLNGRAHIGLGFVPNKEGYGAIRMAGCSGIQEISGQGKYANMKGTLCLNGTLGIKDLNFNGVGVSNCVVVLQH